MTRSERAALAAVTPVAPAAAAPAVTLLTALADMADLSAYEYRAIYDQVAAGRSLRNIELALQSSVSYAWWGKYALGERELGRERKNELRRWAGWPELPPAVAEVVAAHVHPDAAVWQVGAGPASRVVLLSADVPELTLRLNGSCRVVADPAATARVTGVTGPRLRAARGTIHLDRGTWLRLNAARLRAGVGWEAFLAPLEDAAT